VAVVGLLTHIQVIIILMAAAVAVLGFWAKVHLVLRETML
jgi:hypothetical protein